MSDDRESTLSRRMFVRQTGLLAGGVLLGAGTAPLQAEPAAASGTGPLPQKVLGRTGASVTIFTLGTAPCGFADGVSPAEIGRIVNFVDRHTYGFEETILPIARKHDIGIVAMKVFGGARKATGGYKNPKSPPEMDEQHLELAARYALSTPGVNTLNIGAHNVDQVRQNVAMLKRIQPLTADEYQAAIRLGQDLAVTWGEHFGPAKEAS